MRALQRIQEVPSRVDGLLQSLLAQFFATTLELNPSLGTHEFARRLTARTSEMLKTRAAVLVLEFGSCWEIAAISGPAHRWDRLIQRQLATTLVEQADIPALGQGVTASAEEVLGPELAQALAWNQVSQIPLRGSDGALLGVLCLVDPEHIQSKIERQLLESLAGHASVALENVRLFSRIEQSRKQWVEDFDAISDLIVVHGADGRILRLNRALANHLGLLLTEAIGREMGGLELFASGPQREGCPFCRVQEEMAENEFSHESSGRIYMVSTSRTGLAEGSELRTIHVLKDITEKREAERRYRREHDLNRNILNNSQSMILVLDRSGTVRYANHRCGEAGYHESSLVDRAFIDLIATSCQPRFVEALERSLQGNTVSSLELPFLHADGKIRQFSISLSPMRDEPGDIHSVVVMMTDITDAAELQSKLMHKEKMAALGQLVSGVAHEVNNPLAAIVGFTDLLLEDPQISPGAKEDLRVILQEAQRTRVIVQNLLSFARQQTPQQEPVQINALLEQTLKLRAYDLANHGVDLTESFDDRLPPIIGDSQQLQQVFLNILNNAYDAVREVKRSGRIEVRTSLRAGHLEIMFRDNGPGIANPDRIFDPFFTTKEVGKGTGLGLSICYGIVRSHSGEITAHNNPDGMGCTFVLRLPVSNRAAIVSVAERSR